MSLSEKAKEARKQYLKEWKRKNRENVQKKDREYRENNREWYRR